MKFCKSLILQDMQRTGKRRSSFNKKVSINTEPQKYYLWKFIRETVYILCNKLEKTVIYIILMREKKVKKTIVNSINMSNKTEKYNKYETVTTANV